MKLALALAIWLGPVRAQSVVIPFGAPSGHVLDGKTAEWASESPTFQLTGARPARIWVRQTAEGLVVAGDVRQSSPPDFARSSADILRKDHVEIWVAPDQPPKFPLMGWNNNLGGVSAETRKDCIDYVSESAPGREAECDTWRAAQTRHRARVVRLFARQFGLSPHFTIEAYATPAWDQITAGRAERQKTWQIVRPQSKPSFRAFTTQAGYQFESLIPWEALPPFASLDLQQMRLMVDVFGAHSGPARTQPLSSSSPTRKYADLTTLNRVRLEVGRKFRLTGCEFPLQAADVDGESIPALFRPTRSDTISRVMILVNEYGFRLWTPFGDSPTVASFDFPQKTVAPGVVVCGPKLAWRNSSGVHRTDLQVDVAELEAREQPDGSVLMKAGPSLSHPSEHGRIDPCYFCVEVGLTMLTLDPKGSLNKLYEFHESAGDMRGHATPADAWDIDLHIAPDWSRITIYRLRGYDERHWESESICREGAAYQPCGSNPNSGEPSPRVIRPVGQ